MTLPEFWFGPLPTLADDERWVVHLAANRSQGKRAVGGGLHLTTHRLLFCPNVIDVRLGGKPWSCARSEVASVGIEPGRFSLLELFSGALSDRLRLDLHDGGCELFVVANAALRAGEFQELLQIPGRSTELPAARLIKKRGSPQ